MLHSVKEAPVIELDSIDSTNNYAMRLIDADTAQEGLTILAREQTHGKGQRGKVWQAAPEESLMMSLIVTPHWKLSRQFLFNASVAVAIAGYLQQIFEHWDVRIKWPNDIIINDKKAGGILIENVLRGTEWTYAIIGFGLNVYQESFPASLPQATSLKIASGKLFPITDLAHKLRLALLEAVYQPLSPDSILELYHEFLFRGNQTQQFTDSEGLWEAFVEGVSSDGLLQLRHSDGRKKAYAHGAIQWEW